MRDSSLVFPKHQCSPLEQSGVRRWSALCRELDRNGKGGTAPLLEVVALRTWRPAARAPADPPRSRAGGHEPRRRAFRPPPRPSAARSPGDCTPSRTAPEPPESRYSRPSCTANQISMRWGRPVCRPVVVTYAYGSLAHRSGHGCVSGVASSISPIYWYSALHRDGPLTEIGYVGELSAF